MKLPNAPSCPLWSTAMLVHQRCWCSDIFQTSHPSICIFLNQGWSLGWQLQWKGQQKGCGKLRCQMSQSKWINPDDPPRSPASLFLQRCNAIVIMSISNFKQQLYCYSLFRGSPCSIVSHIMPSQRNSPLFSVLNHSCPSSECPQGGLTPAVTRTSASVQNKQRCAHKSDKYCITKCFIFISCNFDKTIFC